MLILCFLITTISTFIIVLITRARRRQSQKKKDTSSSLHSSPLLETQAVRNRLSGEQNQAATKDSGNYSTSYGINAAGRLPNPSWYEPSSSVGLGSSDKGDVKKNIQEDDSDSDEEVSEKASLLSKKRDISPEPTTLGFGEMSEHAGVWYRDVSGKHLTRFIVLHMFLIFSMLMVSVLSVAILCTRLNVRVYTIMSFNSGNTDCHLED